MTSKVVGLLLAVLTVPLTLACMAAAAVWLDSGSETATHTTTVPVGAAPQVSLTINTGSVTVRQGEPGKVTVQQRDTVRGLVRGSVEGALKDLRAAVRGGYGLGVQIDFPDEPSTMQGFTLGGPLSSQRDVTLFVPAGSPLTIAGGTVIHLVGLRGPVRVTSYVGVIRADNLVVTGRSYLEVVRGGGVIGTVTMAGGTLEATAGIGGIQLTVASAGGTHLHAETGNGSLELRQSFGIARARFGSGYTADGVIAGQGPGGQLLVATSNGVITVR